MVRFSFAGEEFAACREGALWWPARRALLVADLHFEKASWFAARGQFLPPYDSLATLAALEALVRRMEAAEIWCLGDSFHDSAGGGRLCDAARARLDTMMAASRWTWITGNHDPAPCPSLGGVRAAEAVLGGIVLRHAAEAGEARPEISGHYHPKLRLTLRGRSVARRCFVAGARKLLLPAFGALTGGLDADHPEIIRAVGVGAEALVPLDDRLLRFALAA
ncbi:MAG: ligase-associated DNA damage response endonuclease PdeM [Sphingomonas sp.]|uniref:ligase-associated DNA damage response endonuclease PdeM n=1 Tax=Sphingomonas sp. TaxID=28214 RepID=UPI0025D52214|nr:ligase-associated DNA damage response endonuclease PdeM [Sphingomonas sp.]MBX9883109.1 ligase-associated DNA damage response endonuclease PdeM [Sphingomonas sp.]